MNISRGDFNTFGPIARKNGITITFAAAADTESVALALFDIVDYTLLQLIKLDDSFAMGRVYSVDIAGINPFTVCYMIQEDGKLSCDPYAGAVVGRDQWADTLRIDRDYKVYSAAAPLLADWEDSPVSIAPLDMVMYKLHMRGFTKGFSMADSKSNYKGLIAKIPYLQDLGVTSVELMPVYDFEELTLASKVSISSKGKPAEVTEYTGRINYWGYGSAMYFAPKASYFGGYKNACSNFRKTIAAFHKAGIEVIIEMSFGPESTDNLIMDCLRYYVRYYHIDGFHILGCNGPIERIAGDPYLGSTKIFYEYIPEDILAKETGKKHLFVYNDSYMHVTRQLQNHMNGSMVQYVNHMRRQNANYGFVNYMASVCGFSLWDSYSYGEKHNLDNGEENRDGTNNNYSYNYGVEGKTLNKSVNAIRFQQMRNAFTCLLMSQAVPLIVAADETAASHEGNNNPYCQDNIVGYTVFGNNKNKKLLKRFVSLLIDFRKQHACIRSEAAFAMNDYKHIGIPDMSFHGREPWTMTVGDEQKALGVLYSGDYAKEETEVYVCYNFHYEPTEMALPLLAPGKRWHICFNTADFNEKSDFSPKPIDAKQSIAVPGSSITVLVGKKP